MGFTIAEELAFPIYGVSATGCYVTIKGSYIQQKNNTPMLSNIHILPIQGQLPSQYKLVCRYYIFASNEAGLSPLHEDTFSLALDESPDNPVISLYNALKLQKFAGKTINDDL